MSYTIDIYRGELRPERNPFDFAFYVAFFPQLVAEPSCARWTTANPPAASAAGRGCGGGGAAGRPGLREEAPRGGRARRLRGPGLRAARGGIVWVGVLAYSMQSTATSQAIRTSPSVPPRLPATNFDFPYLAHGFSDFWRRCTSAYPWLREYLTSRSGKPLGAGRTYRNLMPDGRLCTGCVHVPRVEVRCTGCT